MSGLKSVSAITALVIVVIVTALDLFHQQNKYMIPITQTSYVRQILATQFFQMYK